MALVWSPWVGEELWVQAMMIGSRSVGSRSVGTRIGEELGLEAELE